jgi:Tfp pilus assembly protein PilX
MGKRGIVLLHVLMTAALIAIVAATIMRLAMLRFAVTSRAVKNNQELRNDESALALLTSYWNVTNTYCSSVPGVYSCGPTTVGAMPSSCNCNCSALVSNYPTVSAPPGGHPCQFTFTSADLP